MLASNVLTTNDFSEFGTRGVCVERPKQESVEPCVGCEHNSACRDYALSCRRFSRFVHAKTYYVTPDAYMHEPCEPSRYEYVLMFGDDGNLPLLPDEQHKAKRPLPKPSSDEILEAIEAVKSSEYPFYMKKSKVGTEEEWHAGKAASIDKLRKLLASLQSEFEK